MALSTIPTRALSEQGINFRNLIINGDMSIAQRGTSVTGLANSPAFIIDRFSYRRNGTWTTVQYTMSQETDAPTGQGFVKSLKITPTTAEASVPNGAFSAANYAIEGQDLQLLKYGTSNAESLTLSFWVKSNKTGTYVCAFLNVSSNKLISKAYTIDSSNTWEKKSITIPGDTVSSYSNDNTVGLNIYWGLAAGTDWTSGSLSDTWQTSSNANYFPSQVNLADSTSNYINFTGVQLEVGTSASDFEFLPYDVNLQRCQRYFEMLVGTNGGVIGYGYGSGSDTARTMWQFKVQKRAVPSMSDSYSTSRQYRINFTSPDGTAVNQNSSNTPGFGDISVNNSGYMNLSGFSSIGGGHNGFMIYNNSTTAMGADAEL